MRYFLRPLLTTVGATLTLVLPATAGLFQNGDFESGNTGFSSGYTYAPPLSGIVLDAGYYTVDKNPQDVFNVFYDMGDHTSGSGGMMILNAARDAGIPFWQSSLSMPLTVGEEYDFSFWMASVYPDSPAEITLKVGSVEYGPFSPGQDSTWRRYHASFVAMDQFPVFALLDNNLEPGGNDFAIDDIDIYQKGTTTNPSLAVPDAGPGLWALLSLSILITCPRKSQRCDPARRLLQPRE